MQCRASSLRLVCRTILGLATLALTPFTVHAVDVVEGPTLTLDPNGLTPLAGVVELETSEPVRVQLTITDGNDLFTVSFPDAVQHYLPVLGLKPDRTYTVDVDLIPGGLVGSVFATTGPLPADFPALITSVSNPAEMEPGYTLLDCFFRGQGDPQTRYSSIVDNAGEVVWYSTRCYQAARQLVNGKVFFRGGADAVEMDMLGSDTRVELEVPGIGLHHDLLRTPHGTYLSLTQRSVDVPDFPTSTSDPDAPTAPATLLDDSVVEFLPDGTLRREWPLVDLLDVTRVGYGSLVPTPNGFDWTHSNAINYMPDDDSIIVSVRHQDAIIKLSRETGSLKWILGTHENWSPEFQQFLLHPIGSPFRWQFHQHAPMWTATGTLVLFDNGNFRASPFDGTVPSPDEESFSRGVEFEIDDDAMDVGQIWEYGENIPEQVYSFFISDADKQKVTGNVLMTFGGVTFVGGVPSADLGLGLSHTKIIETTDDVVPVKVFEMAVFDPAGGRIAIYRSEKIPSLYPQRYVKTPNGVGATLRMSKVSGVPALSWATSPVDSEHDAADYYLFYASSSAADGFSVADSTENMDTEPGDEAQPVAFYKIVAANVEGTSGDEPAP